jgi:phage terminase Nu1 subunit (DNA packaging protein)
MVTSQQLVREFGITERWVHRLVEVGMPKNSHGKYDLLVCYRWYVRFLQRAVRKRSIFTDDYRESSFSQERLRLVRAEADLKELQLAKEQGEFVSLTDVEKAMTDLVLSTKARLLAVPARAAPELLALNSRVEAETRLEVHIKEALRDLAQTRKASGNNHRNLSFGVPTSTVK